MRVADISQHEEKKADIQNYRNCCLTFGGDERSERQQLVGELIEEWRLIV